MPWNFVCVCVTKKISDWYKAKKVSKEYLHNRETLNENEVILFGNISSKYVYNKSQCLCEHGYRISGIFVFFCPFFIAIWSHSLKIPSSPSSQSLPSGLSVKCSLTPSFLSLTGSIWWDSSVFFHISLTLRSLPWGKLCDRLWVYFWHYQSYFFFKSTTHLVK